MSSGMGWVPAGSGPRVGTVGIELIDDSGG